MRARYENALRGGFTPAATSPWIAQAGDPGSEPRDGPGGRLRPGAAPVRELEPAVRVLEAPEELDGAHDRRAAHVRDTQRLERSRRVVRVGLPLPKPREAARFGLLREDELRRRSG